MSSINELSFEQAYNELEEIIARLESGDLSLEESVDLFGRGKALHDHCQQLLNNAELRVQQLTDGGDVQPLEN